MNMRRKSEVQKAEQAAFDLLWYIRHKTWEMPQGTPDDIIAAANAKAAQIEATAEPEYLADLLRMDVEYGMLVGRLSTLRWALGMDWDDDGILDT
jgi:hypothetical protein